MDYDSYKAKMLKLNKKLNVVLRFKWLIIAFVAAIVASVTTIAILKGSVQSIELETSYKYGDTIEISASTKMSHVIRYEYKGINDLEWSTTQPFRAGKYELRVISKGLFGNKVSDSYEFEIEKKDLVINLEQTTIKYGEEPTFSSEGLIEGDKINSLTYNTNYSYTDQSLSNTLLNLNLSSVTILNDSNIDVTDCYSITSNASLGKEITFTPLDFVLEPVVSDKVYDGISAVLSDTYTVVENKETGYNDVISVKTAFYKDGKKVNEAIEAGTYEVRIEQTLINGKNHENYVFNNKSKSFEIKKRDLVIETSSATKTYDGTELISNTYNVSDDLAETDTISINTNSSIIDAGSLENKLDFIIKNGETEVNDSYNITYKYGTLTVNKKDLNITTSDASKVYDSTELYSTDYTLQEDLIGEDKIVCLNHTSITDVSKVDNILELEVQSKDDVTSNNYNLNINYGTLEITKALVTIKPKDIESIVYNGKEFNDFSNKEFEIVENESTNTKGQFYNNELESVDLIFTNDLYTNVKNVGKYKVQIKPIELLNYEISYIDSEFEITKASVTLEPNEIEQIFNYSVLEPSTTNYLVKDGELFNDDKDAISLKLHYELNNETIEFIKHVGNYTLFIDDIETTDLIKNNYEFTYNTATCVISPKDVSFKLEDKEKTYAKEKLDFDLIVETDETQIKDLITVTGITSSLSENFETSDDLFNSNTYYIRIDSYSFRNTEDVKESDLNITLNNSIFTILKREVSIKVCEQSNVTYNGEIHEFANDQYIVTLDSLDFCTDDSISVTVKDSDNKTIKNADTYNLVIDTISENLNDNYIINISKDLTSFIINSYEVEIKLDAETSMYDGVVHTANSKFNDGLEEIELYNQDKVSFSVKTENEILDCDNYEKFIGKTYFTQGTDLDSVITNYKFIETKNTYNVTKRPISIKLKDIKHYYYAPKDDSSYITCEKEYLTEDTTLAGIVGTDTLNITKANYDGNSAKVLSKGEYTLSIEEFDIVRDDLSIKDKNYEVNLVDSTLTIEARPITICAISKTFTYSKEYITYDDSAKKIIDYDDSELAELPDQNTYTISYHFEYDNLDLGQKIIDAKTYNVIIDGIVESLDNYDISYTNATYTINPLDVSVYIEDISITYDAKYHSPSLQSEISYKTNNSIIDAKITYVLNSDYQFKDCDTYKYLFTITQLTNTRVDGDFADYTDLLENYNITYNESNFTILKRDVYLELINQEYIYDGYKKEYDTSKYNIIDSDKVTNIKDVSTTMSEELENLVYDVLYYIDDTQTFCFKAGTYIVKVNNITTKLNNYNILKSDNLGTLIINKRKLKAKLNDYSCVYNGLDHYKDITYTIVLDNEEEISRFNTTGYINQNNNKEDILTLDTFDNKFINANTYTAKLLSYSISDNLEVEFVSDECNVVISKRKISIKPNVSGFVYDGETHDIDSHTLDNKWIYEENYEREHFDELTDELRELDIKNIVVDGLISKDKDSNIVSLKNAGTYYIYIASIDNDNYEISEYYSTLVVSQRRIKISPVSKTITYDTLNHINDDINLNIFDIELDETLQNGILIDGTTINISSKLFYIDKELKNQTSVVKNVATYYVKFIYEDTTNLQNFDITNEFNTFTIEKYNSYIKLDDIETIYNGLTYEYDLTKYSLINVDETVLSSGAIYEELVSVLSFDVNYKQNNVNITPKNAGSYVMTPISISSNNNFNVLAYKEASTLVINKRKLVAKFNETDDYSYIGEYNGKNHNTLNNFNYVIVLDNEEVVNRVNITGYESYGENKLISYKFDIDQIIDANVYDINLLEYNFGDNLEVSFERNETKYKINKREISIKPKLNNETLKYTGSALDLDISWEYLSDFTNQNYSLDRKELDVNYIIKDKDDNIVDYVINAGNYTISIDCSNDNYNITSDTIEITVLSRKAIISISGKNTITYDAKEHTYKEFVKFDLYDELGNLNNDLFDKSLVKFVSASYKEQGSSIVLDSVKNAGTYEVYDVVFDTEEVDNFDITVEGTSYITIKKADISIDVSSFTKIYDGTCATTSYSWTDKSESCDLTLNTKVDETFTSLEVDYKFKTSDSSVLTLDGLPILAGNYFRYVDSITSIINSEYVDVTNNYNLIKNTTYDNNYIINKATLSIVTFSSTFNYDGSNHYSNNYSVLGLSDCDTISILDCIKVVDAGEYQNTVTNLKIQNENDIESTSSYEITYDYGVLTVEKALIEFSANGKSFVYDSYHRYYDDLYNINVNGSRIFDLNDKNNCSFKINTTTFSISRKNISSLYTVGTLLDEFEAVILIDNKNVNSNFEITYNFDSYIEVTKQDISVILSDYIDTYNGKDVALANFLILNKDYGNTDYASGITITDNNENTFENIHYAGTYNVSLDQLKFFTNEGKDVTDCYNVVADKSTCIVTINKKKIDLVTLSKSYVWDGNDKSNNTYEIVDSQDGSKFNVYEGESIVNFVNVLNAYNGSVKLLNNSVENRVEFDVVLDGISLLDNYDVTYKFGTLKFNNVYNISYDESSEYNDTIVEFDYNKVYVRTSDNINSGYSIKFDNLIITCDDTTVSQMIDAGTYIITFDTDSIVLSINGIDITYEELINNGINLNIEEFNHTIDKRDILAKIETQIYEFEDVVDGIQYLDLDNIEYEFTKGSLVSGHIIKFSSDISATYPGDYKHKAFDAINIYKVVDGKNIDISKNYNILNLSDYKGLEDYQAKIKINKIKLDIVSDESEFTYDGQYHKVSINNEDEINQILAKFGHKFVLNEFKNVGKYNVIKIVDSSDSEYDSNRILYNNYYEINVELKINKCDISLDVKQNEFIYDAKKHKIILNNEDEITKIVESNGDTFNLISKTDKGTYKDAISITDSEGNNVLSNYNILDIDNACLTIKGTSLLMLKDVSNEFTYDGSSKQISISNFKEIEAIVNANGHSISYVSKSSSGSYDPFIIMNGTVNITSNYRFVNEEEDDVYLTINQYVVTLEDISNSTFEYDGASHKISISNFNSIYNDLLNNHGNTLSYVSITDVDSLVPFKVTNGSRDVTDNYVFVDSYNEEVYLEIYQKEIIVDATNTRFKYDGLSHKIEVENFSILSSYLVNGHTISYVSSNNTYFDVPFVVYNGILDVTNNYRFVDENGNDIYLEIYQADVKILLNNNKTSFEYDGEEHSLSIANLSDIKNQLSDYTVVLRSLKDSDSVTPLIIYKNGVDVTDEFNFVDKNNKYISLTVTQRIVKLDVKNNSFKYDGLNHSIELNNEDYILKQLVNGDYYKKVSIKDVSSEAPFIIYDSNDNDVSENYTFVDLNDANSYIYIEVYEKTIVVEGTFENEFVYDGIAHTIQSNFGINLSLPSGFTYKLNSRTEIGSSNAFIIYDANKNDVTNNFRIVDSKGNSIEIIITYTE